MNKWSQLLLVLCILAYCAWNASNIFEHSGSRFENYIWISFVIWIIPIFVYLIRFQSITANPYFLGGALVISFIGFISSLHILTHIGFAVALASLVPWNLGLLFWLLASVVWMPVYSYFGGRYFPEYVLISRILIAILASTIGLIALKPGFNKRKHS